MVTFWDSGLPLADEYISSCSFNYRIDRVGYINCDDDVHFGYSIISHANQILLNYLCSLF